MDVAPLAALAMNALFPGFDITSASVVMAAISAKVVTIAFNCGLSAHNCSYESL